MAQNTITTKGVLIINGKQVENTFKDLQATTRKLEAELRKLKPGTQEFIDKAQQVKLARQAFENVRNEINATTRELEKSEGIVGKVIKSFGGLGNVFTIGASVSLAATTQELLKISDAITDVQKTSGLAQKEVEALWKEFSNFDTRTSKLELMNIAQIGGRLGITDKEQLQEFTREIDKIYVALGDSFQGGLEEVTTKVGKLKNLFDETKDSDYPTALNEIGSALNELGANGSSSEANMTDFATRVGQLPSALKPAIDKTLGLGAAFEESGIDAQIASSGYSKFVSVAGNNLDAFAKQMKITKEEAQELFRSKPEEFFLKFGESLKGLSADQTSKILSGLKLNTQEVQKALGAAGDNANRFRELMELSSKAMIDGVSIHNEFTQKNENAAAVWEKIGRGFREFFTDGVIPDIFNWVTEIAGKITGVMSEAGDGMERFRSRLSFIAKTLSVVTVAVLSYRTAVWFTAKTTKSAWQQTILYNTVLKVQAALKRAGVAATHLFSAAKLALTGNTQRATVAMRAFNMATRANPIGLLVTAVFTAIAAFALFSKRTDEATEKQKRFANQRLRVQNSIDDERIKLEQLLAVARDESLSKNDREKAIKKLNELSPEYLGNLKLEEINTLQAKKATEAYIKSLEKKALLEILNEDLKENLRKKREAQNKNVANYDKGLISQGFDWLFGETQMEENIEKELDKLMAPFEKGDYSDEFLKKQREKFRKSIQSHYNAKQKDIDALDKEREELQAQIQELLKENPKSIIENNTGLTGDDDGKKQKKYTGDLYSQAQKELLKAQRDFIKKQQELEDEETVILEDSLDKQLSAVETKYERKKLALRHENEDYANEIRDLNKKIREASEKIADPETSAEEKSDNSRAIGVYKKIIAEKRNLIEQNNKMEVTLESTKNHELNTTREKYFTKLIQTQNKEFEKCLNLKKAQSDLEIAEIKTLEQAKQKLQEQGYEEQLHKIRTLEDAKKALRKQAEKEILADTLQSLEAQHALLVSGIQSVSGESAEKLIDDLEKLEEKILQIKTAIATGEAPDTSSIKGTEAEG
ncbi:phage tail tape measure protein, partial [Capnocytophaga canis]|uniref:phage tail tape measure protein n=1 Tax=Capnocytophaga canis TaxID=1848903 RepID=UPI0005A70170